MTRRRFLGLAARPPPPGQRSCRGDPGGGADSSSERRAGEEGSSASRILRFLPRRAGASGGRRGRPLLGREIGVAERSRGDRDSAAKFFLGHPGALRGRQRTRADSVSGPGSEARGPESDRGWHVPRQPAAPARLTSPRAETGLRAPVPASRPRDPRRPLRRCRRSRCCSPPPPRAAAAAQITTRRV